MGASRFSSAQTKWIRQMRAAGQSQAAIGRAIGCNQVAISRFLRLNPPIGPVEPVKRRFITPSVWKPARNEQLVRLKNDGLSHDAAASVMGVSPRAIYMQCRKLRLPISRMPDAQASEPIPAPPETVVVDQIAPVLSTRLEHGQASLPAFHPVSWSAIATLACLDGVPRR